MFRCPARKVAIFDTFDRLVHHIQQNVPATDIGKTKPFLCKFHTSFVADQIPEAAVILFGNHFVDIVRIAGTVTNHFNQRLGFVRTSSGFHQRFRPQQIGFRIAENYKRVVSCPCFSFLAIFFPRQAGRRLVPFSTATFCQNITYADFHVLQSPVILVGIKISFAILFNHIVRNRIKILAAHFHTRSVDSLVKTGIFIQIRHVFISLAHIFKSIG